MVVTCGFRPWWSDVEAFRLEADESELTSRCAVYRTIYNKPHASSAQNYIVPRSYRGLSGQVERHSFFLSGEGLHCGDHGSHRARKFSYRHSNA